MKSNDFDIRWKEFTDSIHRQLWEFEKLNKCSVERFSIYHVKTKDVGSDKFYSTKAEIDYEE